MRRLALILLIATPVLAASDAAFPRKCSWKELHTRHFDLRWIIPDRRVDPRVPVARRPPDLVREMKRLARRTFPAPDGEDVAAHTRTFGDLVAALGRLRGKPRRQARLLVGLKRDRPDVHAVVAPYLPGLVRDGLLTSGDWDPDEDAPDDGIVFAAPLDHAAFGREPWKGLDGNSEILQAVALVWADLDAVKEAECDYAAYPRNVGANYEDIHALPNTYVAGTDAQGRPFSCLRMRWESDLPFPYTSYDCELRILNRIDRDGHLVCDIYSTSEDFHWIAGQDVYVPVRDSDGAFVALLMVRLFGFDLDDVPDGTDDRKAALRSSLGNLKRRAEALYLRRGGTPRAIEGKVPRSPLRGVRARK